MFFFKKVKVIGKVTPWQWNWQSTEYSLGKWMILQRLFIPEEKNTTANKSHMHKFSNFWALLELYKYTNKKTTSWWIWALKPCWNKWELTKNTQLYFLQHNFPYNHSVEVKICSTKKTRLLSSLWKKGKTECLKIIFVNYYRLGLLYKQRLQDLSNHLQG